MSAYFSNHSQSRFLPNTTVTAQATKPTIETPSPPQPQKPRIPSSASSRHFSTTVNAPNVHAKSKESLGSVTPNEVNVHPLRHTWIFWFRQQRSPGNKMISYEDGIKRIAAFSSVESFMTLYTHLTPPSQLQPTTDYLLFHSQIHSPVWEDPLNITGGKWIIRLKKGVADRIWEDLCFAVIGDQFDECEPSIAVPVPVPSPANGANGTNSDADGPEQYPEICGCTISVRQHEDIISLWNRVETDASLREKIKDTFRKNLNLPQSTVMEYKTNNDSFYDKSSFRTTQA